MACSGTALLLLFCLMLFKEIVAVSSNFYETHKTLCGQNTVIDRKAGGSHSCY
jgi:hypothetical protein